MCNSIHDTMIHVILLHIVVICSNDSQLSCKLIHIHTETDADTIQRYNINNETLGYLCGAWSYTHSHKSWKFQDCLCHYSFMRICVSIKRSFETPFTTSNVVISIIPQVCLNILIYWWLWENMGYWYENHLHIYIETISVYIQIFGQ